RAPPAPDGRAGRRGRGGHSGRARGRDRRLRVQFSWRSRCSAGSMVISDGRRRHDLRRQSRALHPVAGARPHAPSTVPSRFAGSRGDAPGVRRRGRLRPAARDRRPVGSARSGGGAGGVPFGGRAAAGGSGVLSEEALILGVLAGACMLLILGVLEQVWPSRPRHPVRRPQAPSPTPPASRPAEPLVSPRLTLSLPPSRPPAQTVFRRPAGYVEPPVRVQPVAPAEPVVPAESVVPEPPARPVISPPAPVPFSPPAPVSPPPSPVTPPPPTNVVLLPERREPVPLPARREIRPIERPEPVRLAEPPEPAPAAEPAVPKQPDAPPLPPRRRRSKISPHARPHRMLRAPETPPDPGAEPPAADVARLGGGPPTLAQPLRRWDAAPPAPAAEPKPKRDSPLVETCFALYQEKRFSEVVSEGEEMLAKLPVQWPAGTSHDIAALQSVIGLAKQALGDDDGARLALEAAIDASPETERPTYRRHLAALSLDAAQARLARAAGHDTGDRVATIRSAIAWSERGLAAVASDAGLAGAREAAYDALWHAYELTAT